MKVSHNIIILALIGVLVASIIWKSCGDSKDASYVVLRPTMDEIDSLNASEDSDWLFGMLECVRKENDSLRQVIAGQSVIIRSKSARLNSMSSAHRYEVKKLIDSFQSIEDRYSLLLAQKDFFIDLYKTKK